MKFLIIGGSPKGNKSVTMQYVKYLEHCNEAIEFVYHQVAYKVNSYVKNDEKLSEFFNDVETSDAIIWAFPLYYSLVHSDYKQFIEVILKDKRKDSFNNKYAISLSTSINYFDHTAHNYIQGICEDLNINYFDGFSANMGDIEKEEGREKLESFAKLFINSIEREDVYPKLYPVIPEGNWNYNNGMNSINLSTEKRIVILTDSLDGNLGEMINQFSKQFNEEIGIYNINEIDIKGGCRGCCKCGDKNICIYNDKDGFYDFYNNVILNADAIIYAGNIVDRYLSWQWKRFFDRHFVYTHRNMLGNKSFIYMVSGQISLNSNLQEVMRGFVEVQGGNLISIISDECRDSFALDSIIKSTALKLSEALKYNYVKPKTFLGVGGRKVFRDEVYNFLRIIFKADHKDYKKQGDYDYIHKTPIKLLGIRITYIVTKIPFISKKLYNDVPSFMLTPTNMLFKKLGIN